MKPIIIAILLCLQSVCLRAQDFSKLPDWADQAAHAALIAPQPPDADQWILLDRTEYAYTGDGEVQTHRYRLVKVLTDRGVSAAVFEIMGLGGKASKVKKLKGWNLRPNGELEKLESYHVISLDKPGDSNGIDNTRTTDAVLTRVVKGSYVAFESLQSFHNPSGPSGGVFVMEYNPIFRWELSAAKSEGWFTNLKKVAIKMDLLHMKPWLSALSFPSENEVVATNVPPLPRNERGTPSYWNVLPRIQIQFDDPDLQGPPNTTSWNGIASWEEGYFDSHAKPFPFPSKTSQKGALGLLALNEWMRKEFIYKAVYLTPERSFEPIDAAEVSRRKYGDCKDLACCFIGLARSMGFKAYPVLARILEGKIPADEPVEVGAFNHVIAAVRLDKSLGFASEVETPMGRFLLVDCTARLTPLGFLPESHRGGRVLLCADHVGTWIEIPEKAIEPQSVTMRLSATIKSDGLVSGPLDIWENGNADELRAVALNATPDLFRDFIVQVLIPVPIGGRLDVISHSDPLNLEVPFHVEAQLSFPRGVTISGSEWDLDSLGLFRVVPLIIQRPGVPRRYPVEQNNVSRLSVHAEFRFPVEVVPYLTKRELNNDFQELSWTTKISPLDAGSLVTIDMAQQMKQVVFGFGEQERGILAWDKNRKEIRRLLDDGLAFKVSH